MSGQIESLAHTDGLRVVAAIIAAADLAKKVSIHRHSGTSSLSDGALNKRAGQGNGFSRNSERMTLT